MQCMWLDYIVDIIVCLYLPTYIYIYILHIIRCSSAVVSIQSRCTYSTFIDQPPAAWSSPRVVQPKALIGRFTPGVCLSQMAHHGDANVTKKTGRDLCTCLAVGYRCDIMINQPWSTHPIFGSMVWTNYQRCTLWLQEISQRWNRPKWCFNLWLCPDQDLILVQNVGAPEE